MLTDGLDSARREVPQLMQVLIKIFLLFLFDSL